MYLKDSKNIFTKRQRLYLEMSIHVRIIFINILMCLDSDN